MVFECVCVLMMCDFHAKVVSWPMRFKMDAFTIGQNKHSLAPTYADYYLCFLMKCADCKNVLISQHTRVAKRTDHPHTHTVSLSLKHFINEINTYSLIRTHYIVGCHSHHCATHAGTP